MLFRLTWTPRGDERRQQYSCDITYGTNNEFGFDYLRDNMKVSLAHMAQGPLEYAIDRRGGLYFD